MGCDHIFHSVSSGIMFIASDPDFNAVNKQRYKAGSMQIIMQILAVAFSKRQYLLNPWQHSKALLKYDNPCKEFVFYISLLIIVCIIYYVTNKETLNLE